MTLVGESKILDCFAKNKFIFMLSTKLIVLIFAQLKTCVRTSCWLQLRFLTLEPPAAESCKVCSRIIPTLGVLTLWKKRR